jgi:hypothetical protein
MRSKSITARITPTLDFRRFGIPPDGIFDPVFIALSGISDFFGASGTLGTMRESKDDAFTGSGLTAGTYSSMGAGGGSGGTGEETLDSCCGSTSGGLPSAGCWSGGDTVIVPSVGWALFNISAI